MAGGGDERREMREGVLRASRHTSGRGVHVGQKVQCRLLEVLGQIGSHGDEDLETQPCWYWGSVSGNLVLWLDVWMWREFDKPGGQRDIK